MVHELSVLAVFATEAKRDTLYSFVDSTRDSTTEIVEGETIVTKPTILGDSEPVKIDKWAGDPYPAEWVEGDAVPQGAMTYSISFSLRFRNTNQRQTIIDKLTELKSFTLGGRVCKHLCGHDEYKGCEPAELVEQWVNPTLTAQQKTWLKEAYSEIEVSE